MIDRVFVVEDAAVFGAAVDLELVGLLRWERPTDDPDSWHVPVVTDVGTMALERAEREIPLFAAVLAESRDDSWYPGVGALIWLHSQGLLG